MSLSSLDIVAPGLLQPPGVLENRSALRPAVLEKLLSWASRQPAENCYEAQLLQLAGLPADTPLAPCALLGEGRAADEGIWMQVTPLHLRADMQNLLLFDDRHLQIDAVEANELVALFNAQFADRGMQLEMRHPQRWYMRLQQLPQISSKPLARLSVAPTDLQLGGAQAARWHAWLTEVQMLFHDCEVNRRRAQQGLPAINAIWVHGAGRLPAAPAGPDRWQRVAGDEVLGLGIAQLAGARPGAWQERPDANELRLFDDFRQALEVRAWLQALDAFEIWLDQAFEWLSERRNRLICLYPCNGWQYRLDGRRIARFWHRPKAFSRFLPE
jgi:hypothetical protein